MFLGNINTPDQQECKMPTIAAAKQIEVLAFSRTGQGCYGMGISLQVQSSIPWEYYELSQAQATNKAPVWSKYIRVFK